MTEIRHLSTDADEDLADDQLPAGHTPVWIEPPRNAVQVQMLIRVDTDTLAGQYADVMVLNGGRYCRAVAARCKGRGWKYHDAHSIYGCEAQCVVLLECPLQPEYLTRARNMLIIFNNNT